jgi:uncharacterized peroxidase-related enzyme
MSRLALFDPAAAEGSNKQILDATKAQLGMVPNLFRALANAPAGLAGYSAFSGALSKGALSAKTRERIALAVAERNGCDYCLAAHSAIGKMVGLDPAAILAARHGKADDARDAAALSLARALIDARGRVSTHEFDTARQAGLDDGAIVEVIANVALNVFTNYVNSAGRVDVDFPAAEKLVA